MKHLILPLFWCTAAAFAADSISVQDLEGKPVSFDRNGKTTVVMFYSTVCPISNDYIDRMTGLYNEYSAKGVQFIFVDANSNESVREIAEHAKAARFAFPVYKDARNVLADSLGATVTPEAYVFDREGALRYHGNIDDARNPARVQVTGLKNALDEVLAGKPVTKQETKAFGCTIKKVKKAS